MIVTVNIETTIRKMQVGDLQQVHDIDQRSFSSPWTESAFRYELLGNKNGHCWVAETDDGVVGFMICWLIVDEIHIATLAVDPNYRGQRISKSLLASGFFDLIPKGASSATLEVRSSNTVAKRLYQHFGFKEVGLRKGYYQDTHEDAILMTVAPINSKYLVWLNSGAETPWENVASE